MPRPYNRRVERNVRRTERTATCCICGTAFTTKDPVRKCCGLDCSQKYNADRNRRPACKCQRCGKEFIPKAKDRTKFCSRECGFKGQDRSAHSKRSTPDNGAWTHWWFKTCPACGATFRAQSYVKFCGSKCRAEDARAKALKRYHAQKPVDPIRRSCRQCGSDMVIARGGRGIGGRTICESCARANKKEERRMRNARVRAKRFGVPYEPFHRSDVVAKYGPSCWVCGLPIDEHQELNTPDSFTVLHVVPMFLGGSHSMENVRPAHHGCHGSAWIERLLTSSRKPIDPTRLLSDYDAAQIFSLRGTARGQSG